MATCKARYLLISVVIFSSSCFKEYKGKINIDGSSSVYPLTEAVAEEFREVEPDVRVTVGVSGTGGGFKKFLRGETDISDASRPISKNELASSKQNGISFIEIPVCYDGMAIVVSPKNDFVKDITVAELKTMWSAESQGKITSWKQVRSSWPDVPLNLYGAGTSSGTYDYFTEAINGKAKSSRGDYTASEDDNVLVQGVSSDKNGLGYFGLAYYSENKSKLKLVPVKVTNNAPAIFPTEETVQNGSYQPLSRPEFIYVNAATVNRSEMRKFIKFYLEQAATLSKEVGYVALPNEVYRLSYKRFLNSKTGSVFADKSIVGVNLLELLSAD
ncbi:PstS family phosphate ABC transporter substrate-binding protein [Pedobacter alpinus]|uniref:Phosphate-binding protein n=1 Tax=Pedobacter alpinus TaxID=1590643 RepID=A0ABW5TQD1_9SPHI